MVTLVELNRMKRKPIRYSPGVDLVLKRAIIETVKARQRLVEPEQLLDALTRGSTLCTRVAISKLQRKGHDVDPLQRELGLVAEVLEEAGVDPDSFRQEMRSLVGLGSFKHPRGATVHRSKQSRRLFSRAEAFAVRFEERIVKAGHLLLAFLEDTDSLGCRLLTEKGVDTEALAVTTHHRLLGRQLDQKTNPKTAPCETVQDISPEEGLHVHMGSLAVYGPCAQTFTYASHLCGLSVVGELTARNRGKEVTRPSRLVITIEEFAEPCQLEIPPLKPGDSISLGTPKIQFHTQKLRGLKEAVKVALCAKIEGTKGQVTIQQIRILGLWSWSHEKAARKTIAAFVLRWNRTVDRIVSETEALLKDMTGVESVRMLLERGTKNPEPLVMEALFRALQERYKFRYIDPRAEHYEDDSDIYQTILPPDEMVEAPPGKAGKGTCLELALLFAACLENAGLCPLVLFSGAPDEDPEHAFVGCCASSVPGNRPILTDPSKISEHAESKKIHVLECTGVTIERRLTYKKAVRSAHEQVTGEVAGRRTLFAVDVATVRESGIAPLDTPWTPVVAQTYAEAEALAKDRGLSKLELGHIFFGLLAVGGETTRWLLGQVGIDPETVRNAFAQQEPFDTLHGEPVKTANFRQCQSLAHEYARQSGVNAVDEHHLLWALLHTSVQSATFSLVLKEHLGTDLRRLEDILSGHHTRPIPPQHTSTAPAFPIRQ